ncbi:MAG TPA: hypothetical protein VH044_13070 [Polyangiaceae bacterium]|jgi:hypothetical protein|nr:hypothetical protein [Polyangiaceae bacterium]
MPPPPPTAVVVPATPLPLPPTTPAPPPAPVEHPLSVGGAVRVGFILQDPSHPKSMSEVHFDPGNYSNAAELRLHGDVTDYLSWTANFNTLFNGGTLATAYASGSDGANNLALSGPANATFGIEDLIAQIKFADEFQIWAGRLLVPSDRANFSGPFFMSPWNYPGFYVAGAAPIGPMEGFNGRNQGVTLWGNAIDAKLKYYVGAYGLDQGQSNREASGPTANAFYSGRISYSLQGSEAGYFGSDTYYGDKNVVTLGLGGQFMKDGSVDVATGKPKDTTIGMADILAEENVTGAGTFSFEAQYYAFNGGYNFGNGDGLFSPRSAFFALFSYLTPENVGVGKLQPLVRWQQTIDPAWTIVDGALAYVMKEYDARVVLTYEHIDLGHSAGAASGVSNGLQLGIQLQK